MKSIMEHIFALCPQFTRERSVFTRNFAHKTTINADYLYPFYLDEAIPGDTFKMKSTVLVRMTTPLLPIMDNIFLELFYFAVPYRLVWENWERFNGAQDNPGDSTDYTIPQVVAPASGGFPQESIFDYFGLPTKVDSLSVSCLPLRAYNLIFNQWFRDENLVDSVTVNTGDAADNQNLFTLLKRRKRKDYFTGCLPWPQKSDTAVSVPIGTTAPVFGNGVALSFVQSADNSTSVTKFGSKIGGGYNSDGWLQGKNSAYGAAPGVADAGLSDMTDDKVFGLVKKEQLQPEAYVNSGLYADLTEASAATINQLREAFQYQKMLEHDALGGTRFTEILRSRFGVISPDARLQRPEYLGGGSARIMINPVQQTAPESGGSSPLGFLAAYAVGHNQNGFIKSFVEHSIIIGLVNIRADITYQNGLRRMWSRLTRLDHFWPELSHLGEQPVYNKEIFCDGSSHDDEVFGYQERYAEYRYFPSLITGAFRHNHTVPLDMWHLSEQFDTLPTLNDQFIASNADQGIKRCCGVTTEPQFYFDSYNELECARPMPVYAVPGLIDHF